MNQIWPGLDKACGKIRNYLHNTNSLMPVTRRVNKNMNPVEV